MNLNEFNSEIEKLTYEISQLNIKKDALEEERAKLLRNTFKTVYTIVVHPLSNIYHYRTIGYYTTLEEAEKALGGFSFFKDRDSDIWTYTIKTEKTQWISTFNLNKINQPMDNFPVNLI